MLNDVIGTAPLLQPCRRDPHSYSQTGKRPLHFRCSSPEGKNSSERKRGGLTSDVRIDENSPCRVARLA